MAGVGSGAVVVGLVRVVGDMVIRQTDGIISLPVALYVVGLTTTN